MKISFRKNFRNGVALLIVMIAIFALAALAAGLAYAMKVETKLAGTANSNQRLVWLGRSGVELARWALVQEASVPNQSYDALNQYWAGGSGSDAESNSVLAGISLGNYQLGDGTISVKIVDLERFANINTANTEELQQTLTLMGVDADDISVVSDSIQDWIDPDDGERIAGAESDYYQGLNPPYNAKNAPIDDMSELLLVKGIRDQPAIYWGGVASNHLGSSFQHKLGLGNTPGQGQDVIYPFGLVDVFTPFSNGKININTAGANVLQLVPGIDTNAAAAILQLRAGPDGVDGTEDDTPFQSVAQISATGLNLSANTLNRYFTVRSSTFQVTVTAKVGDYSRDFKAILVRTGRNVTVNSFYWDTEDKPKDSPINPTDATAPPQ